MYLLAVHFPRKAKENKSNKNNNTNSSSSSRYTNSIKHPRNEKTFFYFQ